MVDRRGEELRRARRGAQDDEVGRAVDATTSRSSQRRRSRSRRSPPSGTRRAACGRRPRRARRRRATPSASRTLTAPSSSRSRDSVAWVTRHPSPASSSASSPCERTAVAGEQRRRCAGAARPWSCERRVIGATSPHCGARRGSPAGGDERVGLRRPEDQRRREPDRVGATALTRKPLSRSAASTSPATGAVEHAAPTQQARARGPATQRVRPTASRSRSAQPLADVASRGRAGPRARSCRGPRAPRRRTPGCRRRSSRAARARAGRLRPERRRRRRSGRPPPRPLASVTTSGATPSAWCANHAPVRPMPVCTSSSDEQRAGPVATPRGRRRGSRPAARRRRPRPASARG